MRSLSTLAQHHLTPGVRGASSRSRELGPRAHRSASARTTGCRGAQRDGLGSKTQQFRSPSRRTEGWSEKLRYENGAAPQAEKWIKTPATT